MFVKEIISGSTEPFLKILSPIESLIVFECIYIFQNSTPAGVKRVRMGKNEKIT